MEDSSEVNLQNQGSRIPKGSRDGNPLLTTSTGALVTGLGMWMLFSLPAFRKVPISLKVPYLPSSRAQTLNVMKLLEGRGGRLADLGSGDGRLVLAASSVGFQSTGFEINSMLLAYARGKACWKGVPPSQATFVNKNFWKADLSIYNNVTAFLAPGVMDVLGDKLLRELPDGACVIACRYPFTDWPYRASHGSGLDQVWVYDIITVRSSLGQDRLQINP